MAFRTEISEDQLQPQAIRASGDERRFARRIDCDMRRDRRLDGYTARGGARDSSGWERTRVSGI
jgi:hypothetical protein